MQRVSAAGCETSRMSLRWWQNSKRGETIQRSSARSSAVLLKKKSASVIVIRPPTLPQERHCRPTARAPSYGNNSVLKNRTVSWCLPGNLGCLFDFLIRSSQPDRSRRPREVQRIPQPCCLKKERGCSSSARAPSYMKLHL